MQTTAATLIIQVVFNKFIRKIEFLLAAANKKKLLSKSNVKQAFDLFDSAREIM